jgi:23S rRNA (guanosine2251-2'-O)-methyltransferase
VKRLLAGPRAVGEALRGRGAASVAVVYVDARERRALREITEAASARRVRLEEIERADLDRLAGDLRHQGVLAIAGEYPYVDVETILAAAEERPLVVALDQVTDPHNFGAIVRSAVAFGADGVVTTKDRAAPVTPVVVRASAGATEHARIARVTNLARALDELRDHGLEAIGLAGDGDSRLADVPGAPGGRVLVIGSEGTGLRRLVRARCDRIARIDMPGPLASLNASVAAGIALYESARLRHGPAHGEEEAGAKAAPPPDRARVHPHGRR